MDRSSRLFCLAAGITAAALPVLLSAPGHLSRSAKAPLFGRNYAHRGLHTPDRSVPENSLAAFAAAAELGYGVELDVQLSKDGKVVVFHDDDLKRVCGLDARVDEKTLEELQSLHLCGTEETIPLFSSVLDVIHGRVPIICELKTGRRNRELCRKTLDLIRGYQGEICIESFDPTIVAWFRFHAPDLVRGQLAAPAEEYKGKGKLLSFVLSRCLLNVIARPQFIAYKIGPRPLIVHLCEVMGAVKVGWTSHSPKNEKGRHIVIFEFYRPALKFRELK